ncbi:MAG: 2Fe-2S iron-sulfur cluster-binding protein [Pseudomonadota bacterium]
MTSLRMPQGGLVDRAKPLTFKFDDHYFKGAEGDTLASALLANGVRLMGRSFKYHRPRGPWGAWVDDPNAIMTVSRDGRTLPNCPATTTYLEEGMVAHAVNAFPSARFDIKGGLDLFHRWLGAGFYYKTFMWPDWHLFEPMIRRMAGLGAVSEDVLEDFVSDQCHETCDLLIVGGGPAGLAAARAAADAGVSVWLVDDQRDLGGSGHVLSDIEGQTPLEWITDQSVAIHAAGGRILRNTTAFGVYDHKLVALATQQGFGKAPRLTRMRAARIMIATGALDRPITFANNDRPGIMSVSAGATYLARYGVRVGERIALVSNATWTDPVAERLAAAGAEIVEIDPTGKALTALGGKRLRGLRQGRQYHQVDTILASGGLTPLVHLWRHAGGKLDWCARRQAFVPGDGPEGFTAVGAANGTFELDPALDEARRVATGDAAPVARDHAQLTPLWPKPNERGRQWIDFQHDVTLKDIQVAAQENYVSVEHLKRYTTLGMATDQGKTSNMSGLAAMAQLQDKPIPEVGTTTFRPPFVPVPIALYQGPHSKQLWHPAKRLPLEDMHRAADAALGEYGGWLRPAWYGPSKASIAAEVLTARKTAGIFDASTLGKIEVMGPDAERFVNFVYYNTIATLKPGRIRYGFMLTESGSVYDDGVIARLAPDRFVVSCSSSHVDGVRMHLEAWRQDGNDPDKIFVHDTTPQWATVTVTGPRAREVLAALDLDLDLSAEAFPHMHLRETLWADQPLRLARVSFTGDLSFEISIGRRHVEALWTRLVDAGSTVEAAPIGLEAMSIMRAEKGYIIIGKDTDGETMPQDLGFGRPRIRKKTAFVGDRGLHSAKANAPFRKELVGLAVVEGDAPLATGAHVIAGTKPRQSAGYVTSSYMSPTLGHPIALGLVEEGHARIGAQVEVWHLGVVRWATICDPCVFDPEGERLHA